MGTSTPRQQIVLAPSGNPGTIALCGLGNLLLFGFAGHRSVLDAESQARDRSASDAVRAAAYGTRNGESISATPGRFPPGADPHLVSDGRSFESARKAAREFQHGTRSSSQCFLPRYFVAAH